MEDLNVSSNREKAEEIFDNIQVNSKTEIVGDAKEEILQEIEQDIQNFKNQNGDVEIVETQDGNIEVVQPDLDVNQYSNVNQEAVKVIVNAEKAIDREIEESFARADTQAEAMDALTESAAATVALGVNSLANREILDMEQKEELAARLLEERQEARAQQLRERREEEKAKLEEKKAQEAQKEENKVQESNVQEIKTEENKQEEVKTDKAENVEVARDESLDGVVSEKGTGIIVDGQEVKEVVAVDPEEDPEGKTEEAKLGKAENVEVARDESLDGVVSEKGTGIIVDGQEVREVVAVDPEENPEEQTEEVLDENALNDDLAEKEYEKEFEVDKVNGKLIVRGIAVSAAIKYKTKDGKPIPRYKNPKNKEIIQKAEEAKEQGKEINGAYRLKEEQIVNKEKELEEKNAIDTQNVDGVEVPVDPLQAEKMGQELAQEASELKIQMMEEQLKGNQIAPDQDKFAQSVELQRKSEILTGAAIDAVGEKNINKTELSNVKKEEMKVEQRVVKMEEKVTKEAEEALHEVERIEEKIQKNNSNLRVGEIGTKEYTEKTEGLNEQKKEALAKLSEKNPHLIGNQVRQNQANREAESEVLGDRHDELNKTILDNSTLAKSQQLDNKTIEIEDKVTEKIEDTQHAVEETVKSQEKTREYFENQKTNYAEGTVGRIQAEAAITRIDIDSSNSAAATNIVNQGMSNDERISKEKLNQIEKYAKENEELGGIVKDLSEHNKLAKVAEEPEIIAEIASAQRNRDIKKETQEKELEI